MSRAIVVSGKGQASIKEVPKPTLGDDQVLVEVHYVGLNPTDYKHLDGLAPPGAIMGCDFSGVVVETNSSILSKGQKVAGFVHGSKFEDRGAFADHLKVDADRVVVIPDGISEEAAPTLGIPYMTAAMAIFYDQKNPWPPAKVDGWFLVQGGTTSVGMYAIELAKTIGLKVVATCSPRSNDLVKSFGADEVVDYHDVDKAIAQIKSITDGGVAGALECVGGADASRLTISSFGPKGGILTCLLAVEKDIAALRPDVKTERILVYTTGGYAFVMVPGVVEPPANPEDRAWHVELCKRTPELFKKYGLKANPVDVREGLDHVLDGLQELKAGKVAGKKLIYHIK